MIQRLSRNWLGLLPLIVGCGSGGLGPQPLDPAAYSAKILEVADTNGDRQLTAEELKPFPGLASNAKRIDLDHNGILTAQELESRIQALDAQSDFIGLSVQVNAKGRPLVGATLTLIPEPYMGEGLQSYSGTTLEGGGCPLHGETKEMPGIPIGFYQAKIVHDAAGINVLRGCAIADDVTGNRLRFDL